MIPMRGARRDEQVREQAVAHVPEAIRQCPHWVGAEIPGGCWRNTFGQECKCGWDIPAAKG